MNEFTKKILKLKEEKNAVILAHYYQRPEIQEIADYVGDSFYLSKIAKECKETTVIFCGVRFMAESAKILSPNKTIILPALDAGCPMADMAEENAVKELKAKHPKAAVVCYINSSTEVKALCDVIVTSSNAEKIISNIPNEEILFLPDKNLGEYLSEKFTDKKFILWPGFCITHRKVNKTLLEDFKKTLPEAKILSHPECEKEIRDLSDFIGSTGEIISYAKNDPCESFIIVTEQGVFHKLQKDNPNKKFYSPGATMTCMNMKKTTLEDVYESLQSSKNEIYLDEEIRLKALASLEAMHKLAR
ncbi:quinolinate synthase NadA [Clostridium cellulovorans]|uniref:Quinolinate synthase n=1 Tax=Clostridium cellulovorans (strain ATCC 35296 / DSM 3052 / OCM 3 / 743B) TaxID=573061 RepID=D9SN41_CLOC7|nr:quinolinate synthase NadA [Clostridium cellulovorans]ADL51907.1 quinolinate synthetase complex, A subunit [Clostridium cellulovorans 743B]